MGGVPDVGEAEWAKGRGCGLCGLGCSGKGLDSVGDGRMLLGTIGAVCGAGLRCGSAAPRAPLGESPRSVCTAAAAAASCSRRRYLHFESERTADKIVLNALTDSADLAF